MILIFVKDFSEIDEHVQEVDAWVHCWVGCAEILVKNEKKVRPIILLMRPLISFENWSTFVNAHGTASWHIIESSFWRRHVGYRFMTTVLELVPQAYQVRWFDLNFGFLNVVSGGKRFFP
jgi:hypothetical protein